MTRPRFVMPPASKTPAARHRATGWRAARTLALLIGASAAAMAGCERDTDSHRKVAEDWIATMEQLVEEMRGVRDEPSAKAAVPRLRELRERMERIDTRELLLPPRSRSRDAELEAEYGERRRELKERFAVETRRILADPRMGRHVASAMQGGPMSPER